MNRLALATAAVLLATGASAASSDNIPKPNCEKPVLPGEAMRANDPGAMKQFNRDLKFYKDCMIKFVDERKAVAEANTQAGNAAIDEYNKYMAELNDQQSGKK